MEVLLCNDCDIVKPIANFSKNQMKKHTDAPRICKDCTDKDAKCYGKINIDSIIY